MIDYLQRFAVCSVLIPVAAMVLIAASPLPRQDIGEDQRRVARAVKPAEDFSTAEPHESMSGGAGTNVKDDSRKAFSHPSANISFEAREDFYLGEALFAKLWVSAPSSTQASDGLGPLFNARACSTCHIRNGRGLAPDGKGNEGTQVLQLVNRHSGLPASDKAHPDPNYGTQLQSSAIQGHLAEVKSNTTYVEQPFVLADGTTHMLRQPIIELTELNYGPLASSTTLSPRLAPPMIGLGLVEKIAAHDLQGLADPDDMDGDGISGRIAWASDRETGERRPGLFGWKATQPTVRSQSAAALSNDMGLSSAPFTDHAGDCSQNQTACRSAPHGAQPRLGAHEVPETLLDLLTYFSSNVAVPVRRDVSDPRVLRGKALFYASGCTACHNPKFVTRRGPQSDPNGFQLIWPYSDFLLHDMGAALADPGGEDDQLAREWRTPPLWGIGLTITVSGHENLLHDGRARNVTEAILWHGGEALSSRDAFAALNKEDRAALERFVRSL